WIRGACNDAVNGVPPRYVCHAHDNGPVDRPARCVIIIVSSARSPGSPDRGACMNSGCIREVCPGFSMSPEPAGGSGPTTLRGRPLPPAHRIRRLPYYGTSMVATSSCEKSSTPPPDDVSSRVSENEY